MSIVTKTGDRGTTVLMYGRCVPKNHPRVEAYGAVDQLNGVLGLARASATHDFIRDNLLNLQKDLVVLMGELAVAEEDLARYTNDGYKLVAPEFTGRVEQLIKEIESQDITVKGWATPGGTMNSAALDLARTTCRLAERRVCDLQTAGQLHNPEIIIFLNRLSDLLWLMARWVEERDERKMRTS